MQRNKLHDLDPDTDDDVSIEELPLELGSNKKRSEVEENDVNLKIDVSRDTDDGEELSIKDLQRVDISKSVDILDKKSGNDGDDEESIEEVVLQDLSSMKKDSEEIPTAEEFKSMIKKYDFIV